MIDSHCHLADEVFAADLEQVVSRAKEAGISRLLCIVSADDDAEQRRAGQLVDQWPSVRLAIGIHPHHANRYASRVESVAPLVQDLLGRAAGARAIGEIGLDYHYDFAPRDIQQEVFRAQVRLAREIGQPVIIHTREADDDTFSILEAEGRGEVRGIFHCFTGNPQAADRAIALGFYLSFAGIITFPRAEVLREAASATPDDRLLVETDSPYLAPVPYRGKRNEPAFIIPIVERLAAIRSQTVGVLSRTLSANIDRVLGPY